MIIHFNGLKNVDKPGVFVFPKPLICLDCGFLGFTLSTTELGLLSTSSPKNECLAGGAKFQTSHGDSISESVPI
jgi:hypothetical protein